jgi:5'-nucleotidase
MSAEPVILLTNDDGIAAEGLRSLEGALERLGRIVIVAPELEQSASSHAITLDKPLRIKEFARNRYTVSGTPTDCVLAAVHSILEEKPDLIVSGINHGPNMGEDVHYSGTVAAALEGCILGITAMAVSLVSWTPQRFDGAAEAAEVLARRLLAARGGRAALWNVNVPAIPPGEIKGIRVTKLGSRVYNDIIVRKKDPRGKDYFWIGGGEPGWSTEENSDFAAVSSGFVSVTPLRIDLTDYQGMQAIEVLTNAWRTDRITG